MLLRALLVALALCLTVPAVATPAKRPMRHDARQNAQKARIQQGVRSGELTRPEAAKLRAEQRQIHRAERRAQADGKVTAQEKARIEHKQDKASADIHKQKHDAQKRPKARR